MKLSADSKSPHYYALTHPDSVRVFVDGVEIKYAVELDTDEGWVDHYPVDDKGEIQIDPENPNEVLMKRITGKVTVQDV